MIILLSYHDDLTKKVLQIQYKCPKLVSLYLLAELFCEDLFHILVGTFLILLHFVF